MKKGGVEVWWEAEKGGADEDREVKKGGVEV